METSSIGPRPQARLEIVEEHLRLENAHDLEGVLRTFGPEARYDDEPWNDHRVGRDQVRSYYEELMAASSDFQIDVVNRYVAPEAAILDVVIHGSHTGPWRGLPATGRSFSFPLCGVFTFDSEDRIFGEKIFYDRATVLRQLGVFREPTTLLGRALIVVNHPLTLAEALGRSLLPR